MHASATIYLEVRYCSVINYSLWWHGSTACRLWNVNNTMQNVATYLSVKLTSRCGPLTLRTAGKSIQYCLCPVLIPCFEGTAVYDGVKSFERVWGREGERKREERRLGVEEKTRKSPDVSEQRALACFYSKQRTAFNSRYLTTILALQWLWFNHWHKTNAYRGTICNGTVSFRVQKIIISLVKWSITSRHGLINCLNVT